MIKRGTILSDYSFVDVLSDLPSVLVLVMAVYWTLELLPLPVTSLLPVVLFPLLGVADTNSTAMVYMKVAVATMNIYLLLNSGTIGAPQCCPHTGGADDVHRKLDGRLGCGGERPSQEDCPQRTQSRGKDI